MLEKDINDLLQDYKHRKNILEEITLSDIEKWNNIDVDVSWDDILNKPTTLEGYGITEELNSRYLNVVDNVIKNANILQWDSCVGGFISKKSSSYSEIKVDTTYDTYMSLSIHTLTHSDKKISIRNKGIELKAQGDDGVNLYNGTVLYTGFVDGDNYSQYYPIVQQENDNLLFGSTKIPNKMNNTLKLPRVNLYNDSNVYEGSLENDTYNIKGVLHDGLRLRHADGKYLMIGHTDNEANKVYSYMICDVDGVLKNESDGDDWGPIRFEQNVFFRNGLRIGSGEDIYFYGKDYGVNSRLNSIERALANGTFTDDEGHTVTSYVDWGNVKNKPSTFTPSSHSHNYLSLTGGLLTGNLRFDGVDGHGINFYNSDIYSIYMSSADNAKYGGRLWETASDYNMYFKMQSGTNRGFVFKNGDTVLGGMDGIGNFRALKMISTKNIYFGSGTTTDVGYFKDGELTFSNCRGIYGKDTNGTAQRIAVVGADNCCYLGGVYLHTYIRSVDNPQYLTPDGNKYNLFHEGYTQKWMPAYNSSTVSSDITTPQLLYTGPIPKDKSGLFPALTNANSILNIGKHNKEDGCYESQLGFSSNGRLYYRNFENQNPSSNPTRSWNTIAFSSDLSAYALLGHQHDFIASMGRSAPKTGRNARKGVYCYTTSGADSTSKGMPTGYCTVIGFGDGDGGCAEIAISYTGNGMWYRYLRDWQDNWSSWVQIK